MNDDNYTPDYFDKLYPHDSTRAAMERLCSVLPQDRQREIREDFERTRTGENNVR